MPEKLSVRSPVEYQVLNWEFFLANPDLTVEDNYFYNYLKYALANYDLLASRKGQATTCETKQKGAKLYEKISGQGLHLWVGRDGGCETITQDIVSGNWLSRLYFVNSQEPSGGRAGNWVTGEEFVRLVDEYGTVQHKA